MEKNPKINFFLINHYFFSTGRTHFQRKEKKEKKERNNSTNLKLTYQHKTEKALQYETRICLQHTARRRQTPIVLMTL